MTITAKPQNKKTKNKTLKIRFGLASKDVFLVFLVFFWFFGFEMQKQKSTWVFLIFWRFMVGENHRKQKNTRFCLVFAFQNQKQTKKQGKHKKKHLLRLNQVVSSKFVFLFWGLAVLVILYILQAFRYTKITNRVYIIYVCVCLCMCVLKDMIQEALRCISGVYNIYIHTYKYIYIHI